VTIWLESLRDVDGTDLDSGSKGLVLEDEVPVTAWTDVMAGVDELESERRGGRK
jgi:hypothetical protein